MSERGTGGSMAMSSIAGLRVIIKLFNLLGNSQRSECEHINCRANQE